MCVDECSCLELVVEGDGLEDVESIPLKYHLIMQDHKDMQDLTMIVCKSHIAKRVLLFRQRMYISRDE